MKKFLTVLIAITICLLVPIHTPASQSEGETTDSTTHTVVIQTIVPTTHTVAIEAEHASALYVEGDKGLSDAYPVPRFSNPQFKFTAEEGYIIKRVLLNGTDVTKEIDNGILKLSEVCENQIIKIETEAIPQETVQNQEAGEENQETGEETEENQETEEETEQTQETEEELSETKPSPAENESDESGTENQQEQEENAKHFNFWWIVLIVLTVGIITLIIILIKRRKKDKNDKENFD